MSHDAFTLTLPPRSEHLATARSFAASVARHFDVVGETVEDLKIAVTEACIDAIASGAPVRVRAEANGHALVFEVDAPQDGEVPGRDALDEVGAPARVELIRALFSDAAEVEASRRAIRFSVPID